MSAYTLTPHGRCEARCLSYVRGYQVPNRCPFYACDRRDNRDVCRAHAKKRAIEWSFTRLEARA